MKTTLCRSCNYKLSFPLSNGNGQQAELSRLYPLSLRRSISACKWYLDGPTLDCRAEVRLRGFLWFLPLHSAFALHQFCSVAHGGSSIFDDSTVQQVRFFPTDFVPILAKQAVMQTQLRMIFSGSAGLVLTAIWNKRDHNLLCRSTGGTKSNS